MTEYISKTQRHPVELWERIGEFRHKYEFKTELEAVRYLIEMSLALDNGWAEVVDGELTINLDGVKYDRKNRKQGS